MLVITDRFTWRSYDLSQLLPKRWKEEILDISKEAVAKTLLPRSVTSREGNPNLKIPVLTVNGITVKERLPWLYESYKGFFCDLAQLGIHEPVFTAENDLYGVVLNIQRGTTMRYECHVDSNPLEGLLYVTDHPKGSGGELVVANQTSAERIEEVDCDCSIVYPVAGNLIFFDARRFPHYVRPLQKEEDLRVVVAMNFYTPTCPESSRPSDLNQHLFGYEPSEPMEL